MEPVTTIKSRAIPFPRANVDTDVIIPARFLKTTKRTGLGEAAFYELRYREDGTPDPDSVFNDPKYQGAQILIAGDNFGCGSSREHAAWGLADLGIRAIIAPSFADIFASNAFKNGILTIELPEREVSHLLADAADSQIIIDLEAQKITRPNQDVVAFDYDPFRKYCLTRGLDEIGITLESASAIDAFEEKDRSVRPWLHTGAA